MAPTLSRDRSLQLALACGIALLCIVVFLMSGCASLVACPAGTYPIAVDEQETLSGSAAATVATQGGELKGAAGRGAKYACKRLCRKDEIWDGVRCQLRPSSKADEAPAEPPKAK